MPVATVRSKRSFRVGRVRGYLRGDVWYLCYHENGVRRRPRAGPDFQHARTLAAQTNGQLETGACPVLSFQPLSLRELRQRWLDHHEHVLRSSVATIRRYRAATEHLLNFLDGGDAARLASRFSPVDAEEFVKHLRRVEVAANGRRGCAKRRLMDKGVRYIVESCRAMFGYAARQRHLSPYAPNPLSSVRIDRIPVEDAKPIVLLTGEQERQFLECCDDWQFPVFLTLMLTGVRPGELCHLLVEDVDLQGDAPMMRVRSKPKLGWQVKTRSERHVPLVPELAAVLCAVVGTRRHGPVFTRPGIRNTDRRCEAELESALVTQVAEEEHRLRRPLDRAERLTVARSLWWEMGALREDRLRGEFMAVAAKLGTSHLTMPKMLRHLFATCLQDGNVDPLIRNRLMGHVPEHSHEASGGLAMTATYTHCRPETVRRQLGEALGARPAIAGAKAWLARQSSPAASDRAALIVSSNSSPRAWTGAKAVPPRHSSTINAQRDGELLM
jgi:integrase